MIDHYIDISYILFTDKLTGEQWTYTPLDDVTNKELALLIHLFAHIHAVPPGFKQFNFLKFIRDNNLLRHFTLI